MLSSRSVGKQTVTGFKICQNPSLIKSLFMKRKLVDVFCGVGKLKEMQREPIYCTGLVPWIAAHAQRQRIKEYILTSECQRRTDHVDAIIGECSPCTQNSNN